MISKSSSLIPVPPLLYKSNNNYIEFKMLERVPRGKPEKEKLYKGKLSQPSLHAFFLGAVEFSFSPNMHELLLQAVGIP